MPIPPAPVPRRIRALIARVHRARFHIIRHHRASAPSTLARARPSRSTRSAPRPPPRADPSPARRRADAPSRSRTLAAALAVTEVEKTADIVLVVACVCARARGRVPATARAHPRHRDRARAARRPPAFARAVAPSRRAIDVYRARRRATPRDGRSDVSDARFRALSRARFARSRASGPRRGR